MPTYPDLVRLVTRFALGHLRARDATRAPTSPQDASGVEACHVPSHRSSAGLPASLDAAGWLLRACVQWGVVCDRAERDAACVNLDPDMLQTGWAALERGRLYDAAAQSLRMAFMWAGVRWPSAHYYDWLPARFELDGREPGVRLTRNPIAPPWFYPQPDAYELDAWEDSVCVPIYTSPARLRVVK